MDEYTLIFLFSRCIRCAQKRDCWEKGSDFSFSSGTTTKAPVEGAKLRYLVIGCKPITRFVGYDYEVR